MMAVNFVTANDRALTALARAFGVETDRSRHFSGDGYTFALRVRFFVEWVRMFRSTPASFLRLSRLTAALLLMGCVGVADNAVADIYKFIDKNGLVHLSDRRIDSNYKLLVRTKSRSARINLGAFPANRKKFTPLIEEQAERYRLDADLVHAVVMMESAYDPRAVSSKGAVGLMQLMPGTASRYGVDDRENPTQNLNGGVRYLRDLLLQFRSVSLALAAYNAGEGAVMRYGRKIPPYPETQRYVWKVLSHYRELKAAT